MKKAELEQMHLELNSKYSKLLKEYNEVNKNLREIEEKSHEQSSQEEKNYQAWKQMNDKFMKRYITELFREGQLQVDFYDSYSGYVDFQINLNNDPIYSTNFHVNVNRNGLEE